MRLKKGVRHAFKDAIKSSFLSSSRKVLNVPTKVEAKLREEAEKKFPGNKQRQDAYIYGTMRKLGWKPEREKKT